jgi:glycosyltransferase involved in cell wall biosynthesis
VKRLLLTYDVPGWAFHAECLDLAWFLARRYPGQIETTIQRASVATGRGFDGVYSSAWYDTRFLDHPRAASQLSSFSYWAPSQKARDRAHLLRRWRWLATKNRALHERLTVEDHPSPRLLYHQINPERWPWQPPPDRHGPFRVGFAGHRVASKGIELIEAAVARLPGVELVTVEWDRGRIPQDAMPAWYHGLHAYVCASVQEGGPRTGLEAMLAGAPLVTVPVGQVSEMVRHGEEAVVVERTVEGIAAGILQLATDHELARRMSAAARAVGVTWAMRWGEAWADFLAEVVGL